jgi:hypothetical protein
MKKKSLLSIIAASMVAVTLLAGCGKKEDTKPAESTTKTDTAKADATTSASVVSDAAAFEQAISAKGKWIIAITKDVTDTKDLVLDGEFKNGKKDDKGNDILQRKIALYTQDDNHKVTARFTLTAPKITIKSPMASIQHGTFKGDVYVNVDNFQLVDAKVDGNIYFATDSAKSTFKMDGTSSVTGTQEVKK